MDPRQLSALGLLGGVTLVLLGVFWMGNNPSDELPEGAVVLHRAFTLDEPVRVQMIRRVDEREERVVLQKREGMWWVVEPYESEADPDVVFGVLDALAQTSTAVAVDATDSSMFGLAPAQVDLTVDMKAGDTVSLSLGKSAPIGIQTYVSTTTGVGVVQGHPADVLTKRAQEYRDHKVFRFDPGAVTRVAVTSALGKLEATKGSGDWFLTNYSRADLNALDDWIVDLTRLRVDLFLDLDHATIEDPRFRVEVETPDGIQELLIGRDTPYGPLAFFKGGLDGVVEPGLLAMLERGPTDVGVSSPFPFVPDKTRTVTIQGAETVVLEAPFDLSDPRLVALQTAQFTYARSTPAWTTTELTVTVVGERTQSLAIGPLDEAGFRPVRDLAGGEPVRVPADELADLF